VAETEKLPDLSKHTTARRGWKKNREKCFAALRERGNTKYIVTDLPSNQIRPNLIQSFLFFPPFSPFRHAFYFHRLKTGKFSGFSIDCLTVRCCHCLRVCACLWVQTQVCVRVLCCLYKLLHKRMCVYVCVYVCMCVGL